MADARDAALKAFQDAEGAMKLAQEQASSVRDQKVADAQEAFDNDEKAAKDKKDRSIASASSEYTAAVVQIANRKAAKMGGVGGELRGEDPSHQRRRGGRHRSRRCAEGKG